MPHPSLHPDRIYLPSSSRTSSASLQGISEEYPRSSCSLLVAYIFGGLEARQTQSNLIFSSLRIEPIVYEKVMVSGFADSRSKLFGAIDSVSEKFAKHSSFVCFSFMVSQNDAIRILTLCKHVLYIACWINFQSPPLFDVISTHRPRRLSLRLYSNALPDFSQPFFSFVTHLELMLFTSECSLTGLGLLDCLTYLCLIFPDDGDVTGIVRSVLAHCKGLQACLLLLKTPPRAPEACTEVDDQRVVIVPYRNPLLDFEAFLDGFPDMWTIACDFIQKRHRARNAT
jgi:hypothetical protein